MTKSLSITLATPQPRFQSKMQNLAEEKKKVTLRRMDG